MIINCCELQKTGEEAIMNYFNVVSQYLPVRTEASDKKPLTPQPTSRPKSQRGDISVKGTSVIA
jgi:hypothetical protein